MVRHGDLFDVLPTLEAESIDACATDPPYGIGFMGKEWDTFKPGSVRTEFDLRQRKEFKEGITSANIKGRKRSPAASPSQIQYDYTVEGLRGFQEWTARWAAEVFRVLKPGAYLVVCGAPRSYHRMACGLEDAGFVIRDKFSWLFGSGFPKNYNLGAGKGTALKPAHEPIALAWKPFKGTIKACHETHGTAALNIDACRIECEPFETNHGSAESKGWRLHNRATKDFQSHELGRWPANVLLDEEAAAALDEMTGELFSGGGRKTPEGKCHGFMEGRSSVRSDDRDYCADVGGASRFYYVAKPSREERDMGCYDLAASSGGEATDRKEGSAGLNNPRAGAGRTGGARNIHPTVKPVELMRWLVRLVTPLNGLVLDPFTGSGTTGMACVYEQRRFIGIEREAEYVAIAERRIRAVAPLFTEIA